MRRCWKRWKAHCHVSKGGSLITSLSALRRHSKVASHEGPGASVLWALRSPCNLNCQYCYFGTAEEAHIRAAAELPGQLSHAPVRDVSSEEALAFAEHLKVEDVRRVFLAGGEPLRAPFVFELIERLKRNGCEVIVCTNGLPLCDSDITAKILTLGVDAVSISLDSYKAEYNDHWRVDPRGGGFNAVVEGIRSLVSHRRVNQHPVSIGIYTVVTRQNLSQVVDTGRFVAELGVDYFIIQPISLAAAHPLYRVLALQRNHRVELDKVINDLMDARLPLVLPHSHYLRLMSIAVGNHSMAVRQCFGGRDLFFIEPDGSVWDCPSFLKIEMTRAEPTLNIRHDSPGIIFSKQRRTRNTDCALFSCDCVNMWQLMAFDSILAKNSQRTESK